MASQPAPLEDRVSLLERKLASQGFQLLATRTLMLEFAKRRLDRDPIFAFFETPEIWDEIYADQEMISCVSDCQGAYGNAQQKCSGKSGAELEACLTEYGSQLAECVGGCHRPF